MKRSNEVLHRRGGEIETEVWYAIDSCLDRRNFHIHSHMPMCTHIHSEDKNSQSISRLPR